MSPRGFAFARNGMQRERDEIPLLHRDKEDKAGPPVTVETEDDADALIKAAASIQMSLEFPIIEVWQARRLVGQIPHRDHIDAPHEAEPAVERPSPA